MIEVYEDVDITVYTATCRDSPGFVAGETYLLPIVETAGQVHMTLPTGGQRVYPTIYDFTDEWIHIKKVM